MYLLHQSREGNRHIALQTPANPATTSENETETAFDAWKQIENDANGPQRTKDKSSREELEQAFFFSERKKNLKKRRAAAAYVPYYIISSVLILLYT